MTSIEYLFKELWETSKDKLEWHSILNKAKEMHKQEIVDAHHCGRTFENKYPESDNTYNQSAEQYYQETFRGTNDGFC